MPFLENRHLKQPPEQPNHWINSFISKVIDLVDVPIQADPNHLSSASIYLNFLQLCVALHPRSVNAAVIKSIFRQLYQIEVNVSRQMKNGEYIEKIFKNNHRLQWNFIFDRAQELIGYDICSFFIFNGKLVFLHAKCDSLQSDCIEENNVALWSMNYLVESFNLTPGIQARFNCQKGLFEISHHDNPDRLSYLQLSVYTRDHIVTLEILGDSADATSMIMEYTDYYNEKLYVEAELPGIKDISHIDINEILCSHEVRVRREGHDKLWICGKKNVMAVWLSDNTMTGKIYDERDRVRADQDVNQLSLTTFLNQESSQLSLIRVNIGRLGNNGHLRDGLQLRICEVGRKPVIRVNIFKPNQPRSFVYKLYNRSSLQPSVNIDERVHQQLGILLDRSRLTSVLKLMIPQFEWGEYFFDNNIVDVYIESDKTSGNAASQPGHILTSYTDSMGRQGVTMSELDGLMGNPTFCPPLPDRFIELMLSNFRKHGLPKNHLIQPIYPLEASTRTQLISEYAQGINTLMAWSRNNVMQIENKARNKAEADLLRGFMQINKKFHDESCIIQSRALLSARNIDENQLFSEYQRGLVQLEQAQRLIMSECLERRRLETAVMRDLHLHARIGTRFFETLAMKRETANAYVSQRKAIVSAASEDISRIHRHAEERLALLEAEQQARAALSSSVLDNPWTFFASREGDGYTLARRSEFDERFLIEVEAYVDILKCPCESNTQSKSILETLFLLKSVGYRASLGGSSARACPYANDLDVRIAPRDGSVTDEQRYKLFLILQDLIAGAREVHGYPEKGFMTFEIHGLRKPINFVIYMNYKGEYQSIPLYNNDVIVRIERKPRPSLPFISAPTNDSSGAFVDNVELQFYVQHYDESDLEKCVDERIDARHAAQLVRTQQIYPRRYDPDAILRVLREIAYFPAKEGVNATVLRDLIRNIDVQSPACRYQEKLFEFYDGKHKVAPPYFSAFLGLLRRYGLPLLTHSPSSTSITNSQVVFYQSGARRFGLAHLIELLVERHINKSRLGAGPGMLQCIKDVLERMQQVDSFKELQDFATRIQTGVSQLHYSQPADDLSRCSI